MNQTLIATALTLTAAIGLSGCRSHEVTLEKAQKYSHAFLDDALDDVKATKDQRERIQALREPLVADGFKVYKEGKEVKAQLFAQWKQPTPDASQVHALIDGHASKVVGLIHRVADAMIAVHGILTPEQRGSITDHYKDHFEQKKE